MERLGFVKNGVVNLPPGFRFHPTDEELVVQYLKRKVFSCPLPATPSIMLDVVDLCKSDPWELPGDPEQERYFFSTRVVRYGKWYMSKRATNSGFWNATGTDKQIVSSKTKQLLGLKRSFVFYTGKSPHGCRTNWSMVEYRLANFEIDSPQSENKPIQENWVLYRVFLKKGRNSIGDENMTQLLNSLYRAPPASSPSSCSSVITELSTIESDDHEESSSCNSFTTSFRRYA